MHVACHGRHVEAIKLLVASGANAHAVSEDSDTPLYAVAWAMLRADRMEVKGTGCGASAEPFAAETAEICTTALGAEAGPLARCTTPSLSAEAVPSALRCLVDTGFYTVDDRFNVATRLLHSAPSTAGASGCACVLDTDLCLCTCTCSRVSARSPCVPIAFIWVHRASWFCRFAHGSCPARSCPRPPPGSGPAACERRIE